MIHVHNWLTLWLLPTLQRFLSPLRWSKAAATMRLSKLEMITVTWPRFLMGFDLNRFLGFHGITLWLCQNSYWKWPFIVDLPKMGWFSIVMLVYQRVLYRSGIDVGRCFSVFGDFLGGICCSVRFPCNLQNLELEAAISTVLATSWSSNLSVSMIFATFWCSNFVARVHLGFV